MISGAWREIRLPPGECATNYARVSGMTGSTDLPPETLDNTPAVAVYHAAIAVATPNQPPALMMLAPPVPCKKPMPSTIKVMNSSTNTSAVAPLVRNEASIMIPVNMPQAIRYHPTAEPDGPVLDPKLMPNPGMRSAAKESQNAP